MPSKTCIHCHVAKSPFAFGRDSRKADGRATVCATCKSAQQKAQRRAKFGPPMTEIEEKITGVKGKTFMRRPWAARKTSSA